MIRQGDVLVRPVRSIEVTRLAHSQPIEAENGRFVLAHGEATGHHHSVALSQRVAMFRDDGGSGGRQYLAVCGAEPVSLEHQEHAALAIAPGLHEVVRQRVYTAGMARRVAD